MNQNLANRLEDIPGVESVVVDLTDQSGGIRVRLAPDANEPLVMEKLRSILVAYGVRTPRPVEPSSSKPASPSAGGDVEVLITPIESGARVEVHTPNVRSFRVVPANPDSIAQGLADAWCQVKGQIPVEIFNVSIHDGLLSVAGSRGGVEAKGVARVSGGWEDALTSAVGQVLDEIAAAQASPVAANS